jgi:hypothetical protein
MVYLYLYRRTCTGVPVSCPIARRLLTSLVQVPVAPQPARQHPHRMQPSYSVSHPVGAAHIRHMRRAQQPDLR